MVQKQINALSKSGRGCGTGEASMLVLFAGGGTGGHLLPALATACAMRDVEPKASCVFLASRRTLESFRESFAPYRTYTAPELRWLGPGSTPRLAADTATSLVKTLRLFRRLQPDVVVGTGGWSCAPAIFAARMMHIPNLLFEANAVPGRAVRVLALLSDVVQLQWKNGSKGFLSGSSKALPLGTPVRAELFSGDRRTACKKYRFDPFRATMLVMGGTQGALALNRILIDALVYLGSEGVRLQVLHITGKRHLKKFNSFTPPDGIDYRPVGFEKEMRDAYAAADFVLCRAGGGTLAELSALGLPAILVPYPHATGAHQLSNAKKLAETGAAILVEQENLKPQKLAEIVRTLLEHKDVRMRMKGRSLAAGRPRAARDVAKAIAELAHRGALQRMRNLQFTN